MFLFSTSKKLIKNVDKFIKIKYFSIFHRIFIKDKSQSVFYGWGRKKSGLKAQKLAYKYNAKAIFLEDGFLRSIELGFENNISFSLVFDDIGIYYDGTKASKLEYILNNYDFNQNPTLLKEAQLAIDLITKYQISKYNKGLDIPNDLFKDKQKRILIIAQSANDLSLKYAFADSINTQIMINDAIKNNKDAIIYIKIHPDALNNHKKSDFSHLKLEKNCHILKEDYNIIALLDYFDQVYTKSSQVGFEALIRNKKVVVYGLPFYAGWGLSEDKIKCTRRTRKLSIQELVAATLILYPKYLNPYTKLKSNVLDCISTLNKYKNIYKQNSNTLFFIGFSLWKRSYIKDFFKQNNNEIIFLNSLFKHKKFKDNDKIFIWGMSFSDEQIYNTFGSLVQIYRVEDGFIRSISLGSDLTRPFSLVIDKRGLYTDSNKTSDLEFILQNYTFNTYELLRASKIQELIIQNNFSKYNQYYSKKLKFKTNKKIILIISQIEDDISMLFSNSNLNTKDFIKKVRQENKNAYIVYKMHPDITSGNRQGLKDRDFILLYCDEIIENINISSCLNAVDEIHTISSQVGFEALIRNKKVVVYGLPFYAGWGLSEDKIKCTRRTRKLSIQELVAATLILYPRYINKNKELCEFEACFDDLLIMKDKYFNNTYFRFYLDCRAYILRKIRRLYEKITQI